MVAFGFCHWRMQFASATAGPTCALPAIYKARRSPATAIVERLDLDVAKPAQQPPQDLPLEKGIPQALDIERFVLGAAFVSKAQASFILEALEPEDFFLSNHKIILSAMKRCSELDFTIDRVTVIERLTADDKLEAIGGVSYITSLDEGIPELADIKGYIRILKDKTKLRQLLFISRQVQQDVLIGAAQADTILGDLNRSLYTSFAEPSKGAVQSIGEYIQTFPGGINALLQPFKISQGVLTGFDLLDDLTDGFHEAEIITVGAGPGQGKTALMLGVCENIARRGSRVLIFSQEMSRRALFNRLVCMNADVSVIRFRRGDLDKDERIRVGQATQYLSKLHLEIDETSGLTVPDVAVKLRREHDRKPVTLFAIDFVQLMHSILRGGTENDRLTEICTGLQNLCKTTGIPLLLLSQISRRDKAKKDWRPSLESLRSSGTIEIVSNVVVMIHREEAYDSTNADVKGKAEWIVAKNREGETKTLMLGFTNYLAKFRNL